MRNAYLAEGNAKQARKRVNADAIVRDTSGRILFADPAYKPDCAPSSSATKARPKSASGPMPGAGQAPRWKRWGPAGHGICRTGTPKLT